MKFSKFSFKCLYIQTTKNLFQMFLLAFLSIVKHELKIDFDDVTHAQKI